MIDTVLAQTQIPSGFFLRESILTFTGMVAVTYVICNAAQRAFNFNPRWLGLAIALLLCLLGTLSVENAGLLDYGLALVNGCLVYLSAAGGTQVTAAATQASTGTTRAAPGNSDRRDFATPWF